MTSKQKYLVKITEYFFDGHGCSRKGKTTVLVTEDKTYSELDDNLFYRDLLGIEYYKDEEGLCLEDIICNDKNLYAQDGYNCIAEKISIEEISNKRAEEIENIIKLYKAI